MARREPLSLSLRFDESGLAAGYHSDYNIQHQPPSSRCPPSPGLSSSPSSDSLHLAASHLPASSARWHIFLMGGMLVPLRGRIARRSETIFETGPSPGAGFVSFSRHIPHGHPSVAVDT